MFSYPYPKIYGKEFLEVRDVKEHFGRFGAGRFGAGHLDAVVLAPAVWMRPFGHGRFGADHFGAGRFWGRPFGHGRLGAGHLGAMGHFTENIFQNSLSIEVRSKNHQN